MAAFIAKQMVGNQLSAVKGKTQMFLSKRLRKLKKYMLKKG